MLLISNIVVGAVIVTLVAWFIGAYNGFVELKNNYQKSMNNIDVLLKQRTDEIPNLMACVQGYMDHERNTLEAVTLARTHATSAGSIDEKAAADSEIAMALKTLFAVAESYPQLKANENFVNLQARISGLESEIADRREFYNDSVTIFNTKVESFPDLVVAGFMQLKRAPFFRVSEADKIRPAVSFSTKSV